MERKKFIKNCCYTVIGLPLIGSALQSCGSLYYASSQLRENKLVVAKTEFWKVKNDKKVSRKFVLIKTDVSQFPICLYKLKEDEYVASLLRCTHRSCELNVGGGIYSCPCHGSEFSISGKVIEGPAIDDLKTYRTDSDNENIYIELS